MYMPKYELLVDSEKEMINNISIKKKLFIANIKPVMVTQLYDDFGIFIVLVLVNDW